MDAPGIAVLVSDSGRVRHLKGYGLADLDAGIPVTPDTLFDLASVSKQMTALAVALLVEDGTLSLDTEVGSLLDDTDALFVNGRYDNGRPIDDGAGERAGYGYGWSLYRRDGERHAGHAGSWMGTAAYYQRNLDSGLSVIVLANGEDLDAQSLAEAVADAVE